MFYFNSRITMIIELKIIWSGKNVIVVPIAIGNLETVRKNCKTYLEKLEINVNFDTIQRNCLFGRMRILGEVLIRT